MTSEQIAELRRLRLAAVGNPDEHEHTDPRHAYTQYNELLHIHAPALLDAADENVVLRAEVVAWRIDDKGSTQQEYKHLCDCVAATDAAGALEGGG